MNIQGAKRLEGESFEQYKERIKQENKDIKRYLNGNMSFISFELRHVPEDFDLTSIPEEMIVKVGGITFIKQTRVASNPKRIRVDRKTKKEIKRKRKIYKFLTKDE